MKIPRTLAERLSRRAEDNGFGDLAEYLTFFVEQVLSELEAGEAGNQPAMSREEEASVKKKLRDLGYA